LRDAVGSDRHSSIATQQEHPWREELVGIPIAGTKYLDLLREWLGKLRAQYRQPNRVLFYDDVVLVYLLAFFNPAVRSLRLIEDFSQIPSVRRRLSVEAVRRSTLSDANALFDPSHLLPLIAQLRSRVGSLPHTDGDLATLLDKVVAIDGSFFKLAADVDWAINKSNVHSGSRYVRLNLAYSQKTGLPVGCSVSGDDGQGEGTVAIGFVESEQIYLFDSGVVSFDLLATILERKSDFVCNLREAVNFAPSQELPLDEKDRAAGVTSDHLGVLTGSQCRKPPGQTLRQVRINYVDRHRKNRQLRILTSLLNVPAHVIAALYRHRWQIELFFRWLKVHANFRHLTSYGKNGITLSFYVAVIAQLLISLHTNQPLNRYGLMALGMVAAGNASVEDILPILERRHRERAKDKERLAKKKAAKKSET
jgi:hypothetical protein